MTFYIWTIYIITLTLFNPALRFIKKTICNANQMSGSYMNCNTEQKRVNGNVKLKSLQNIQRGKPYKHSTCIPR